MSFWMWVGDDRRPITAKRIINTRNHVVVEEDDAEKGIK